MIIRLDIVCCVNYNGPDGGYSVQYQEQSMIKPMLQEA